MKLNFWYSPTKMFKFKLGLNPYESRVFDLIFYRYTQAIASGKILMSDSVMIKYESCLMKDSTYWSALDSLAVEGWITYHSKRGRNGGTYVALTEKTFDAVKKRNWEGSWPVRK